MVFIGTTAHSVGMGRAPYKIERPANGRGHYIPEWREWKGLTQEQVAGRTEMSVPQISKIENGHRDYRQSTLELFAFALGCEPKDLLGPPPSFRDEISETLAKVARLDPDRQAEVVRVVNAMIGEAA